MQATKSKTTKNSVTVIGLGPMGQAMANVFLEKKYSVTLWNRTADKAKNLIKKGAVLADSVAGAFATNELVILSLPDYDIMYKVLDGAEGVIKGRTLVNLSSDTPKKAREAETWAKNHGANFLSGGVMVDPPLVGKPEAFAFYSGDRTIFETHQATLEILGKTDYRGDDAGLSQLYYQALLNIMFTSATAVIQSIAMVRSAGISAKIFEPYLHDFLSILPYFFEGIPEEIDRGEYKGDQNNMQMMAAGAVHVAHTSRDANTDMRLPDLVRRIYDETIANGHGKEGLPSIIEIMENPSPAA